MRFSSGALLSYESPAVTIAHAISFMGDTADMPAIPGDLQQAGYLAVRNERYSEVDVGSYLGSRLRAMESSMPLRKLMDSGAE
jgi:hypothetical protein